MKNKIIFLFVFLSLVLSACKKEFLKPTDLCDCFTITQKSFRDIIAVDSRFNTVENEKFVELIDLYLNDLNASQALAKKVKSTADKDHEYVHSVLNTGKRNTEDTVVIYVPNFDHANFEKNPVYAISEILDDSISGGEDRIWGAYIDEDEENEIKYIILDEEHAMNTSRPVFIFDTRFISTTIILPENGNPIEGAQAQAATGDKYFISYVQSFIDLDNDNSMEISYGIYAYSNYIFRSNYLHYNQLTINDNQIGTPIATWYNIKPIPPSFTEFPFSVNHFTPLIIYDHDWPASTKTFYLYPPSIYLFPNTNVYNVKFKPRMTNSSTKLIAWGNITLSDIQNGWYLPVNYCPDGRYGIYHFN